MSTQIELISKQLKRVFAGPAWHGPSVMETLEKIKIEHSTNSYKNSHSLVEIVGHMTAWRNFAMEQLNGNQEYEVVAEMNFPKTLELDNAIAQLKESQENLIKSISRFQEARLKEKVARRPYSFQTMLHGIMHHDLYHLGQIALLNR